MKHEDPNIKLELQKKLTDILDINKLGKRTKYSNHFHIILKKKKYYTSITNFFIYSKNFKKIFTYASYRNGKIYLEIYVLLKRSVDYSLINFPACIISYDLITYNLLDILRCKKMLLDEYPLYNPFQIESNLLNTNGNKEFYLRNFEDLNLI